MHRRNPKLERLRRGRSRAKGSRVGDDLVEAFEEMAKHLSGEIELEGYDPPKNSMTPAECRVIAEPSRRQR
jgi:putative transcriptional regulator